MQGEVFDNVAAQRAMRPPVDAKGRSGLHGKQSQCTACGLCFTSVSGFDAHRYGEYTDEPPRHGRSCMTAGELSAAGWTMNMVRGYPFWSMPMSETDKQRIARLGVRKLATQDGDPAPEGYGPAVEP